MPVTHHSPLFCILSQCVCFSDPRGSDPSFFVSTKYSYQCTEVLCNKASLRELDLRYCVLHFILMPHPHLTEMQHQEVDAAQVVICGMAATIGQQGQELAELKEALREIIQVPLRAFCCPWATLLCDLHDLCTSVPSLRLFIAGHPTRSLLR